MATTKYKIAEQVMRLLGASKQAMPFEIEEVMEAIGQVVNKGIKAQYFNEIVGSGERTPDGMVLATYENVAVSKKGNRSRILLPAFPVGGLPMGMGVYQISPMSNIDEQYIPVPPGQWWMLVKEGLISDLLGMVGYEVFGSEVVFTKDLTTLPAPVASVLVRMVVTDVSRLSDYDMLPIPADMEADVIKEVYALLSGKHIAADLVDPTSQNKGAQK